VGLDFLMLRVVSGVFRRYRRAVRRCLLLVLVSLSIWNWRDVVMTFLRSVGVLP